jgi:carboxylesterase
MVGNGSCGEVEGRRRWGPAGTERGAGRSTGQNLGMTAAVLPGADAWSHHAADGAPGALVVHGFTGNPSSMRILADAFAAAGYHVELPRLPGHGTAMDDMLPTRWADWLGEAERAYQALAARSSSVVVVGLSMGGALTLRLGLDHPEIVGLVCVNPAAQGQPAEVVEMLTGMADAGTEVMPGIGSDIADPDVKESAYEGTPVRALVSLVVDGLGPLSAELPNGTMPLLLCTSPQDHVVDPAQGDFLAATWGGPVERVLLERSYHVATQDFDKDLVVERALAFAARVTGS